MTHSISLPDLALLTVRDPKAGAEIVLRWNLPRDVLWTAVVLVGVVTTILASLGHIIMPLPEPLRGLGERPFVYLVIAVGGFVSTVLAVYWTGRMMGGQGNLFDFMTLLLWLQTMRTAAQAIILICLVIAPALGGLVALFVGVATLWIFVNFISIGLRLDSIWRAVFVLIVGALAFLFGLSLLMSLIGVFFAGGIPNAV